MTGKGQEMAPIMHKFMHKIAGDESKRALLGADEIDRNQRQNAGEEEPGDNFPEGYWNRPCCWRLCEALHVLPRAKMPGSLSRDSDTVGVAAPAVNTAKTGPRQRDVARLEEKPGVCLISNPAAVTGRRTDRLEELTLLGAQRLRRSHTDTKIPPWIGFERRLRAAVAGRGGCVGRWIACARLIRFAQAVQRSRNKNGRNYLQCLL